MFIRRRPAPASVFPPLVQIVTGGHSPVRFRAQTVRNLDAWYKAFDVKPGDDLYLAPADRIRVW